MYKLNIASVLATLDMALKIKALAPKFARAVGLVVSAYGLYALTVTLGSNKWVVFTSCIISIVYFKPYFTVENLVKNVEKASGKESRFSAIVRLF